MTNLAPGLFAALAFSSLTSHAVAQAHTQGLRSELQVGMLESGVTAQGGVFLPFFADDGSVVYGNFRGGLIGPELGYAAVGIGTRRDIGEGFVLGAHAHVAFSGSSGGNTYQQVVIGAEAFSGAFEFRANANLPFGETQNASDGHSALTTETGRLGIRQGYEQAMTVLDVEAGYSIPLESLDSQSALKLFAGAYAQFADDVSPVYGVSGRAEFQTAGLGGRLDSVALTLGAGVTHDGHHGTNASVYGRLSFDIDGGAYLGDPLYARTEFNPVVQTRSGAFGEVQNAVTSDGRIAGALATVSPETGDIQAINETLRLAGENAVLMASGDLIVDDAITMASGQIWLGGNSAITLTAEQTGTALLLENTGARAHVTGSNAAHKVFEMADYASVISTDITGGATAIYAKDVSTIVIEDVAIANAALHGIMLDAVHNARVEGVNVSGLNQCEGCGYGYANPDVAQHAGLYIWGGSDIEVEDLSVDGSTYGVFAASKLAVSGSDLESALNNVRFSHIDIRNTREEAFMIAMADAVAVSDLVIDNTEMARTKDSVVFLNTTNATLERADIAGGINGIMIANAPVSAAPRTGNIAISDVTIRDTSLGGIFINPSENVRFSNVQMRDVGSDTFSRGIFMLGGFFGTPISDAEFENVSVIGTPGIGLQAMGDIENVRGNIEVTDASIDCSYNVGPWSGSLTQAPGYELALNGQVIEPANSGPLC